MPTWSGLRNVEVSSWSNGEKDDGHLGEHGLSWLPVTADPW